MANLTTQMKFVDARPHLSEVVSRVEFSGARIVFTRNGRQSAALVSIADLHALQSLDKQQGNKER